jgi:hypothetical protein
VQDIPNNPTMVYGYSFLYLYKIDKERGNLNKSEGWKNKFLKSKIPNKEAYLKNFK